jgi:hypothetical protein
MTFYRKTILMLTGLALLGLLIACGAAAPTEAPQAEPEEPAAPETTSQPSAAGAPESTVASLPTPTAILVLPTGLPTATAVGGEPEVVIERPQPAITENRRLTLEFPAVMRLGDSTRIRLQLEVDDRGNVTPTAVVEGNVISGEVVQIPDLYETHNVIAEARLDLAGMQVQPSQAISEPLSPGKAVTFYWSVRPAEAGDYRGSVWLHLRFLPKSGGMESRIPLSVQFLDIQVNSFLGLLSGRAARGFGAAGSAIGTVLGIPFLGDLSKWILKRIWGKRKTKT